LIDITIIKTTRYKVFKYINHRKSITYKRITQKTPRFVAVQKSVFAEIFEKSAKFVWPIMPKRGKIGSKSCFQSLNFQKKCNFILLIINKIRKKCRKK
jgi:hypothetical protein